MRNVTVLLLAVVILAATPCGSSRAEEKLTELLPQFFAQGIRLEAGTTHTAHFEDPGEALQAMGQLNASIASQFATYPLGSTSGAFTYQIGDTGLPERTSESFGPLFAERVETLGQNKVNFGVTSLYYQFDTLEDLDLRDGDFVFNLRHIDESGDPGRLDPYWEGDLMFARLFLDLTLHTEVLFATFGVTDRLDLGIAVPYVRAELDARVRSTILPLGSLDEELHEFQGGGLVQDTVKRGEAQGLGDIVLRGKYRFRDYLAAAFDLRLPTGDEADLLGSGAAQFKVMLVANLPKYDVMGGFYPHINLGYTLSNGGYSLPFSVVDPVTFEESKQIIEVEPSNELNYAVGFDLAMSPRVTFATDIVGRLLLDAEKLSVQDREFLFNTNTSGGTTLGRLTLPEVVTTRGHSSIMLATAGLKIHLGAKDSGRTSYLISGSVLAPIGDDGLQDELAASVGLDVTF